MSHCLTVLASHSRFIRADVPLENAGRPQAAQQKLAVAATRDVLQTRLLDNRLSR